jgi:hypothetical protein
MTVPPKDSKPASKPPAVPAPGSLPKLPQTIFNLEKKGGQLPPGSESRRS